MAENRLDIHSKFGLDTTDAEQSLRSFERELGRTAEKANRLSQAPSQRAPGQASYGSAGDDLGKLRSTSEFVRQQLSMVERGVGMRFGLVGAALDATIRKMEVMGQGAATLAIGVGGTALAFMGMASVAGTAFDLVKDGFRTSIRMTKEFVGGIFDATETYKQAQIALQGTLGNAGQADRVLNFAMETAKEVPGTFKELIEIFKGISFVPSLKPMLQEGASLDRTLRGLTNTVLGLKAINPLQTVQGTIFAVREFLAGQFRSIQLRFNVSPEAVAASIGKSLDEIRHNPRLALSAIQRFVSMNLDESAIAQLAKTVTKQIEAIGDTITQMRVKIGLFGQDKGLFEFAVRGLEGFRKELDRFQGSPYFMEFAKRTSAALIEIGKTAIETGKTIAKAVANAITPGGASNPVETLARGFVGAIEFVRDRTSDFFKLIESNKSGITDFFGTLKDITINLGHAITPVASAISTVASSVASIAKFATGSTGGFLTTVLGGLGLGIGGGLLVGGGIRAGGWALDSMMGGAGVTAGRAAVRHGGGGGMAGGAAAASGWGGHVGEIAGDVGLFLAIDTFIRKIGGRLAQSIGLTSHLGLGKVTGPDASRAFVGVADNAPEFRAALANLRQAGVSEAGIASAVSVESAAGTYKDTQRMLLELAVLRKKEADLRRMAAAPETARPEPVKRPPEPAVSPAVPVPSAGTAAAKPEWVVPPVLGKPQNQQSTATSVTFSNRAQTASSTVENQFKAPVPTSSVTQPTGPEPRPSLRAILQAAAKATAESNLRAGNTVPGGGTSFRAPVPKAGIIESGKDVTSELLSTLRTGRFAVFDTESFKTGGKPGFAPTQLAFQVYEKGKPVPGASLSFMVEPRSFDTGELVREVDPTAPPGPQAVHRAALAGMEKGTTLSQPEAAEKVKEFLAKHKGVPLLSHFTRGVDEPILRGLGVSTAAHQLVDTMALARAGGMTKNIGQQALMDRFLGAGRVQAHEAVADVAALGSLVEPLVRQAEAQKFGTSERSDVAKQTPTRIVSERARRAPVPAGRTAVSFGAEAVLREGETVLTVGTDRLADRAVSELGMDKAAARRWAADIWARRGQAPTGKKAIGIVVPAPEPVPETASEQAEATADAGKTKRRGKRGLFTKAETDRLLAGAAWPSIPEPEPPSAEAVSRWRTDFVRQQGRVPTSAEVGAFLQPPAVGRFSTSALMEQEAEGLLDRNRLLTSTGEKRKLQYDASTAVQTQLEKVFEKHPELRGEIAALKPSTYVTGGVRRGIDKQRLAAQAKEIAATKGAAGVSEVDLQNHEESLLAEEDLATERALKKEMKRAEIISTEKQQQLLRLSRQAEVAAVPFVARGNLSNLDDFAALLDTEEMRRKLKGIERTQMGSTAKGGPGRYRFQGYANPTEALEGTRAAIAEIVGTEQSATEGFSRYELAEQNLEYQRRSQAGVRGALGRELGALDDILANARQSVAQPEVPGPGLVLRDVFGPPLEPTPPRRTPQWPVSEAGVRPPFKFPEGPRKPSTGWYMNVEAPIPQEGPPLGQRLVPDTGFAARSQALQEARARLESTPEWQDILRNRRPVTLPDERKFYGLRFDQVGPGEGGGLPEAKFPTGAKANFGPTEAHEIRPPEFVSAEEVNRRLKRVEELTGKLRERSALVRFAEQTQAEEKFFSDIARDLEMNPEAADATAKRTVLETRQAVLNAEEQYRKLLINSRAIRSVRGSVAEQTRQMLDSVPAGQTVPTELAEQVAVRNEAMERWNAELARSEGAQAELRTWMQTARKDIDTRRLQISVDTTAREVAEASAAEPYGPEVRRVSRPPAAVAVTEAEKTTLEARSKTSTRLESQKKARENTAVNAARAKAEFEEKELRLEELRKQRRETTGAPVVASERAEVQELRE